MLLFNFEGYKEKKIFRILSIKEVQKDQDAPLRPPAGPVQLVGSRPDKWIVALTAKLKLKHLQLVL